MKVRSDFVTNSSSSSFIAIRDKDCSEGLDQYRNCCSDYSSISLLDSGNKEFGWDFTKYNDFDSKLNYLLLQVIYAPDLRHTLDDVIESDLGLSIDWMSVLEEYKNGDAYIDHQSTAEEIDLRCLLENSNNIRKFLYNDDSCIITGNDNVYSNTTRNGDLDLPYRNNSDYILV